MSLLTVEKCTVSIGPAADWKIVASKHVKKGGVFYNFIQNLCKDTSNCRLYLDGKMFLAGISVSSQDMLLNKIAAAEAKSTELQKLLDVLKKMLDAGELEHAKSAAQKITENLFGSGNIKVDVESVGEAKERTEGEKTG